MNCNWGWCAVCLKTVSPGTKAKSGKSDIFEASRFENLSTSNTLVFGCFRGQDVVGSSLKSSRIVKNGVS